LCCSAQGRSWGRADPLPPALGSSAPLALLDADQESRALPSPFRSIRCAQPLGGASRVLTSRPPLSPVRWATSLLPPAASLALGVAVALPTEEEEEETRWPAAAQWTERVEARAAVAWRSVGEWAAFRALGVRRAT